MRPAMLLFSFHSPPRLCNSFMRIYYAQYNQMTDFETEYVFCKDNRLVLIGQCLFAKASTANAGAWALEAPPSSLGATAHLHLKKYTQNQHVWAHTLKVAILTHYKNVSVGYIELKHSGDIRDLFYIL